MYKEDCFAALFVFLQALIIVQHFSHTLFCMITSSKQTKEITTMMMLIFWTILGLASLAHLVLLSVNN